MATLASGFLTFADWAKRLDPEGKIETNIAEILNQTNEILDDAVFVEGNLPTGHRVTIRTGLPSVYWRSVNQGVPRSKSTSVQVDESCGMLEAYSAVDKDLAELNGNTADFRWSEDQPFLESMAQTQAQTLFYGNPGTDPRQYLGLATRYGTISGSNDASLVKFQQMVPTARRWCGYNFRYIYWTCSQAEKKEYLQRAKFTVEPYPTEADLEMWLENVGGEKTPLTKDFAKSVPIVRLKSTRGQAVEAI